MELTGIRTEEWFSTAKATAHIRQRDAEGMRPGGYGLLLASGTVNALIYNEVGNEVFLINCVDLVPDDKSG